MKRNQIRKRWKTRRNKNQKGGNQITIDAYKDLLSTFCYSDAKHDFDSYYTNNKSHITGSIPTSSNIPEGLNENILLKSIDITNLDNNSNIINFSLQGIIDMYEETDGILRVNMKFHDNIQREYMIYVVHYQDNEDVITDPDNFLMYFGGMRSFIIDYFTLKFF